MARTSSRPEFVSARADESCRPTKGTTRNGFSTNASSFALASSSSMIAVSISASRSPSRYRSRSADRSSSRNAVSASRTAETAWKPATIANIPQATRIVAATVRTGRIHWRIDCASMPAASRSEGSGSDWEFNLATRTHDKQATRSDDASTDEGERHRVAACEGKRTVIFGLGHNITCAARTTVTRVGRARSTGDRRRVRVGTLTGCSVASIGVGLSADRNRCESERACRSGKEHCKSTRKRTRRGRCLGPGGGHALHNNELGHRNQHSP